MTQHTPATPRTTADQKMRRRTRMRRWALGIVGGIVTLAVVAAWLGAWTVTRSFPQTVGALTAAGLEQPVTVQRDDAGVPTITAESTHDLFFAQGLVHAQDRFWEMDFRRHLTSARLSELFGESQLGTDKFLRSLGWRAVAEQEVEMLSPEILAYYDAYAEGVNAYLSQRTGAELSLEYAVLGLQNADYTPEPWDAADSVAWLKAMAWDLRTNVEEETERALLAQHLTSAQLDELYPPYPFDEHPIIEAEQTVLPPRTQSPFMPEGLVPAQDPAGGKSADAVTDGENAASSALPESDSLSADATAALPWAEINELILAADSALGDVGEGVGSNSWAVAGNLTESGRPLLANDPHLGASLPSVWSQMQLRCGTVSAACPFDVAGFSFSGLPGIVIGHNRDIAWGFTNLTTDVADLYVERVDGNEYWRDGKLVPLETRTETIKVAGGDDVELEIRSTVHGPIISELTSDFGTIASDPKVGLEPGAAEKAESPDLAEKMSGEYAVSLRWTALDPGTSASAIFGLNLARNFGEFRTAGSMFDVPAQNLLYADLQGNIGYQAPGKLPIRGAGDGWLPQPGWDSAYDWQGTIPFEELPAVYNPESGYIVTANNAIVDDSYPYFLSRDWDYGYRAAEIERQIKSLSDEGPITAQQMRDLQMNNDFAVAKDLQGAFAAVSSDDPATQQALALLADWDGQNDADSAGAAYANVVWRTLLQQLFTESKVPLTSQGRYMAVLPVILADADSAWWSAGPADGPQGRDDVLRETAEKATRVLVEAQGSNQADWNWGELHAITLTNGTFGTSGIAPIEALFNRGPFPVSGGSSVVNATGWKLEEGYATTNVPSLRMVVDLSDFDNSTWHHLTGASGHAFHPHYIDQTAGWATGEQRPWAFSNAAVALSTRDTLTLVPEAAGR